MHTAEPSGGLAELLPLREAIEASGDIVYDWDLASDALILIGQTDGLFGTTPEYLPTSGEAFGALVEGVCDGVLHERAAEAPAAAVRGRRISTT